VAGDQFVRPSIARQQRRLKSPPVSMAELLTLSERLGLIETVAELRRLMI
jgi:hypothetical protein